MHLKKNISNHINIVTNYTKKKGKHAFELIIWLQETTADPKLCAFVIDRSRSTVFGCLGCLCRTKAAADEGKRVMRLKHDTLTSTDVSHFLAAFPVFGRTPVSY